MSGASRRIVIAAGGTAGHVVPAIAVAEALRADGAEIEFIGADRAEAQMVPAAGFALHQISVAGLSRSNPLRAMRALVLAAAALARSRSLLASLRPDVVMGGGGYVAGPVGLAALSLRIPLVLTEADSHLGLTNRLLAPFARTVCLAFSLSGRDGRRYRVTGRPIPPPAEDRAGARERFAIPAQRPCVLVFGGSLGARSINLAAVEAFGGGSPRDRPPPSGAAASSEAQTPGEAPVHVLHVCGRRDHAELSALALRAGYDLREYLDPGDFAAALAASDLVIARAGGSVFEIAAHGRPAILVPYPHAAGDHQSENARWMSEAGAATVIADAELSGVRLYREATDLLADPQRLATMGSAALSLARPHAAREVADELLAAARG